MKMVKVLSTLFALICIPILDLNKFPFFICYNRQAAFYWRYIYMQKFITGLLVVCLIVVLYLGQSHWNQQLKASAKSEPIKQESTSKEIEASSDPDGEVLNSGQQSKDQEDEVSDTEQQNKNQE